MVVEDPDLVLFSLLETHAIYTKTGYATSHTRRLHRTRARILLLTFQILQQVFIRVHIRKNKMRSYIF